MSFDVISAKEALSNAGRKLRAYDDNIFWFLHRFAKMKPVQASGGQRGATVFVLVLIGIALVQLFRAFEIDSGPPRVGKITTITLKSQIPDGVDKRCTDSSAQERNDEDLFVIVEVTDSKLEAFPIASAGGWSVGQDVAVRDARCTIARMPPR